LGPSLWISFHWHSLHICAYLLNITSSLPGWFSHFIMPGRDSNPGRLLFRRMRWPPRKKTEIKKSSISVKTCFTSAVSVRVIEIFIFADRPGLPDGIF
jgi:hypothetical protein